MHTRYSRKAQKEKGRKKFGGQRLGVTPKSWLTPKSWAASRSFHVWGGLGGWDLSEVWRASWALHGGCMVMWEGFKTGLLLSSSFVVIVLRGNLFMGVTLCVWGNFCVVGGTPHLKVTPKKSRYPKNETGNADLYQLARHTSDKYHPPKPPHTWNDPLAAAGCSFEFFSENIYIIHMRWSCRKSTENNKIKNEQPPFKCQPAFGSHSQSLTNQFFSSFFFVSLSCASRMHD